MTVQRTVPSALNTHLQGDTTSLCTLWEILRRDGEQFFFTDLDVDIQVGGNIYKAAVGYERSSFENTANLAPGNTDLRGILNSSRIDEDDLRAGRFDYAAVEITLINWSSPSDGEAIIQTGKLGEVTYSVREGMFTAEMRDLSEAYAQRIIESFIIPCRADIGDTRCGLPVLPDEIQNNTAYAVGDVVRVRAPRDDVVHLHAPGSADANDDSQYAATGTVGSEAAANDGTNTLFGNNTFYFNPTGGPTSNPSNSFVSWPDAAQHTIGHNPFTIEAWVNFEALQTAAASGGPVIASKYDSSANQRSWVLAVLDSATSSPGLTFIQYDNGGSTTHRVNVPLVDFTPELNHWYHIAVSRDDKLKLRIFVDGDLRAVERFPYDIFDGTAPVRLGMFNSTPGGNRHFEGSIFDFRIVVGDFVYRQDFVRPTAPLASSILDNLDLGLDYGDSNYRCTVAGTTHATLPFVFFSNTLTAADTGTTTLSVTAPSTFTRPAGSFVDDGFLPDMVFTSSGFTNGANNGTFRVASVAAASLVVTATSLVTETGGGDERIVQVNQSNGVAFAIDNALRVAGKVLESQSSDHMVLTTPDGTAGGGLLALPLYIENPGFEVNLGVGVYTATTDIGGWTVSEGAVEIHNAVTGQVRSGTYSIQIPNHWTGSSYATIQQTRDVTSYASLIDAGGETITVAYWYWSSGGAGRIFVQYDFLDAADALISSTANGGNLDVLSRWIQFSQQNTIPALTRKIRIRLRGGEGTAEPFIDDITVATSLTDPLFPSGEFEYGVATFETGLNAGLSMEIKAYNASAKTFMLFEKMPFAILPEDLVSVHIGCNREASRCKALGNILRHRGFRFIPGDTKALRAPALA